jgi:hypothetical protein
MGPTSGRLSFTVLMVKLFGTMKNRRRALWTLWWSQLITNGLVVITIYVQCKDVRALWDFSVESTCWPTYVQTVRREFFYSEAANYFRTLGMLTQCVK